jgi:Tfp pilus assembly protein PilV
MHTLPHPIRGNTHGVPRRERRAVGGFTLFEVMVAAVVIVATGVGIFTILVRSYELVAMTRYRDDARAVLQTFASQFQHLESADNISGTNYDRVLFTPTDTATGAGLLWDSTSTPGGNNLNLDSFSKESSVPPAVARTPDTGLKVKIGGSQNGIVATVTRKVVKIAVDGSSAADTLKDTSAGQLLLATFDITYTINGFNGPDLQHQSMVVLRAAP